MNELCLIEEELAASGVTPVCGVDEAGRGPLAGPVCAAACILPRGFCPEGLDDSKKLSPKKRDKLYDIIIENALSYGIAFASVGEIESLNILNATFLAMNRAIEKLEIVPALALIDGNTGKGVNYPNRPIVGGDGKCACIAAASILAKVTRDRYMIELAEKYPQYGFEKHKGYATKLHYQTIREFGACGEHRQSFLKKMH